MSVYNFDIETQDKIKQIEFLRGGGPTWEVNFTEYLKKIKEREKYDRVWEKIKIKLNWL